MQGYFNLAVILAGSFLFLSVPVRAQVNKCIGSDGKVTYTDGQCQQRDSRTVVNARPNTADHGSRRLSPPDDKRASNRSSGLPAPATAPSLSSDSGSMSSSEKANRRRSLEMDIEASNSTWEKRSAAKDELARLERDSRVLTSDEEQRLRNARVGLISSDRGTRERALSEFRSTLRSIYGY